MISLPTVHVLLSHTAQTAQSKSDHVCEECAVWLVQWDEVSGLEDAKAQLQDAVVMPAMFPRCLARASWSPGGGCCCTGPPALARPTSPRSLSFLPLLLLTHHVWVEAHVTVLHPASAGWLHHSTDNSCTKIQQL